MWLCNSTETVSKALDYGHMIDKTEVEIADRVPDNVLDRDITTAKHHFSLTAWKTVLQIRKRIIHHLHY